MALSALEGATDPVLVSLRGQDGVQFGESPLVPARGKILVIDMQ